MQSDIGDTTLDLLEKVFSASLASHWDPNQSLDNSGVSKYIQYLNYSGLLHLQQMLTCHTTVEREVRLREKEQAEARDLRVPGRLKVLEILRNVGSGNTSIIEPTV
jgi:hypothetical protein